MAKDLRWVDPAPLEVSRPRLPWWTTLPGWVKLVLSPVVAVVLLGWAGYQFGRAVSVSALVGAVGCGLVVVLGAGAVVVLLGGFVLWRWRRDSFERYAVPCIRTEFRRLFVYVFEWRSVMRLSELTKGKRGREYRSKLGRVRAEGWRDLMRVNTVKGPAPE